MSIGWINSKPLTVKDIDFANNLLIIRSGKGEKDRTTVLRERIKGSLKSHLQKIKQMHDQDLANGYGVTKLADALEKKYRMPIRNGPGNGCSPGKARWSIL